MTLDDKIHGLAVARHATTGAARRQPRVPGSGHLPHAVLLVAPPPGGYRTEGLHPRERQAQPGRPRQLTSVDVAGDAVARAQQSAASALGEQARRPCTVV